MPKDEKVKELVFALWLKGRSLPEIQATISAQSGTKPGGVAGWLLEWERGRQAQWVPEWWRRR